jgi:hypothetical protein
MKKYRYLFVFGFLLFSKLTYCDVIPYNVHSVTKCVKITNIEDYPEISLLGFTTGTLKYDTYVVTSSSCLTKGYKYNDFNVFTVNKTYLSGKDITNLNLPNDPNAVLSDIPINPYAGYVSNSIPISSIEQFYKIVGFSDVNVVLFKWKELTKFNNGKPDSTKTYTYDGEVSKLYQKIQTGINPNHYQSSIELYPNPAQKNFHIKIDSNYQGSIPVEIVTLEGKIVKSFTLSKTGSILDYDIRVESLSKGAYFVKIKLESAVESKKIIIK